MRFVLGWAEEMRWQNGCAGENFSGLARGTQAEACATGRLP